MLKIKKNITVLYTAPLCSQFIYSFNNYFLSTHSIRYCAKTMVFRGKQNRFGSCPYGVYGLIKVTDIKQANELIWLCYDRCYKGKCRARKENNGMLRYTFVWLVKEDFSEKMAFKGDLKGKRKPWSKTQWWEKGWCAWELKSGQHSWSLGIDFTALFLNLNRNNLHHCFNFLQCHKVRRWLSGKMKGLMTCQKYLIDPFSTSH